MRRFMHLCLSLTWFLPLFIRALKIDWQIVYENAEGESDVANVESLIRPQNIGSCFDIDAPTSLDTNGLNSKPSSLRSITIEASEDPNYKDFASLNLLGAPPKAVALWTGKECGSATGIPWAVLVLWDRAGIQSLSLDSILGNDVWSPEINSFQLIDSKKQGSTWENFATRNNLKSGDVYVSIGEKIQIFRSVISEPLLGGWKRQDSLRSLPSFNVPTWDENPGPPLKKDASTQIVDLDNTANNQDVNQFFTFDNQGDSQNIPPAKKEFDIGDEERKNPVDNTQSNHDSMELEPDDEAPKIDEYSENDEDYQDIESIRSTKSQPRRDYNSIADEILSTVQKKNFLGNMSPLPRPPSQHPDDQVNEETTIRSITMAEWNDMVRQVRFLTDSLRDVNELLQDLQSSIKPNEPS